MNERLLSTGDVAEVLGVSEATIKRWADAGTLTCIRTPGGHRKFRFRDMAAYLASRAPRTSDSPEGEQRHVEMLAAAMMVGDVNKVMAELAPERLQRVSLADLAQKWLIPAFQQVSEGRSAGTCHAFHELMALHVLQDVAVRQRAQMRRPRSNRGRLLVVAMPGALADGWSRFAGLVGVESGYGTHVLAAGLEADEIAQAAQDLAPNWCVIVTTDLKNQLSLPALEKIASQVPKTRFVVAMLGDVTDDLPSSLAGVQSLLELRDLMSPSGLRMRMAHRG